MNFRSTASRVKYRLRREAATRLARRPLVMRNTKPLVSFTFDDFPRSALLGGGAILRTYGVTGTFFASFGLMDQKARTGEIFSLEDLHELVRQKHELGCHTFDHCHAWDTPVSEFHASIIRNREALKKHLPGTSFKSFSYPISCARPQIKRCVANYFDGCRGGGQSINIAMLDLNYLNAFFIEQSKSDFGVIARMIENNARQNGWLIFATHDVCRCPTTFGCTEELFERIVKTVLQSGARILPLCKALHAIRDDAEIESASNETLLASF